jgi:1-acyl-sn-glycerol-3-phosphate acyltransferase
MIPARKSPFLSWFMGRHAEGRLRRDFRFVKVHGLQHLRDALSRGPVLLISNHTSWWDPMFCMVFAHRLLRFDGYAMMDAENLRKLPFLGRIGAFGVERGHRDEEALTYAAERLSAPNTLVWVFPQGDERPITERPLGFKQGAAVIAHAAPSATTIPLAIRYHFGSTPLPEAWLAFGPPVSAPTDGSEPIDAIRAAQEAAVTAELDRIDARLRGSDVDPFETLYARAHPLRQRLAEGTLAWFTGRHRRLPPPRSAPPPDADADPARTPHDG